MTKKEVLQEVAMRALAAGPTITLTLDEVRAVYDAADEIERLQRELAAEQARTPEACLMLEEENQRLRAELEAEKAAHIKTFSAYQWLAEQHAGQRLAHEPSVELFEVKMRAARESNGLHLLRVACTCPSDTELDPRCFVAFPHPWHAVKSECVHEWTYTENKDVGWCVKCRAEKSGGDQ